MCGIAGKVYASGGAEPEVVARMLDAQRHRGPDAHGLWHDSHCALGHRRLSILDLSDAGRQPMGNEDGSLQITFNGEVYNFAELRAELEGLGHRFHSRTDTEVIVHAYEQWGVSCVQRLRGMFAFAIWDSRKRQLFAARDRVGKKPFYFRFSPTGPETFAFASEVQGLLADPSVSREVDRSDIHAYLSWGYVPCPGTGLKHIRKLQPGHWMRVEVKGDKLVFAEEGYWSLNYGPKLQLSEAEAGEALREKLTEAVRLRLVSDVPLGAFLSGGIDSSIVVGLMAAVSDRPVKTFSIGFTEAAYNELDHARRVAERWGTDHHEHIVKPDALAILPMLVRHYGEPYADSSAVPTYYVSQMTRAGVTVALNGDGGDESFAGYERYLAARVAEKLRKIPGSRAAAAILQRLVPDSIHPKNKLRRLHRFLAVAHRSLPDRYGRWVSYFHPEEKEALYTPELQAVLQNWGETPEAWMERQFRGRADLDPVEAAMAVDVANYLPYDLLAKVDIATMACGLEARSPFLDHEVMEFAARLPVSLKLNGKTSKYLLKRAFADLLPPENVNRGKMGFGVPVGDWFRGPLKELLVDTVLSQRARDRGYFRTEEVQRIVDEHLGRQADHAFKLWSLLMLELWHREIVEARPGALVGGA